MGTRRQGVQEERIEEAQESQACQSHADRCEIMAVGGTHNSFKKTALNQQQCYQKCPNFGFSPNSDLCTEIVLIWYDFSYQDQH